MPTKRNRINVTIICISSQNKGVRISMIKILLFALCFVYLVQYSVGGGASIDPTQTTATFFSHVLTTNNPVNIQIDAYDGNSNHMSTTNSDFEIHFTSFPAGALIDTDPSTNNGPGVYALAWSANKPGTYTFDVLLSFDQGYDGEQGPLPQKIQGSPFTNVLRGPTSESYVTGFGVTGGKYVGSTVTFVIHAADASGDIPTGGDNFAVIISSSPNGKRSVPHTFVDNNDGTYTATYTVTKPGAWRVDATLDGVPIKGSSFKPIFKP